jgi:hypothetical protein
MGIRVQAKGTVRVGYPCLGMGISFTEMSEEAQRCAAWLPLSLVRVS